VAGVIQLHSAAGHDEVNVRMIDRRIASPRVEHTEEAELASAQTLGRLAHIADGCGSGIEQRVIARALVSAQHRTDPVRHGNRDQKMLHRQQATRLFGHPSGRLLGTAAWAVAIAATPPEPVDASAIVTTVSHAAEFSGTATRDRADHLAMADRNRCAKLRQVRRCVLPELGGCI